MGKKTRRNKVKTRLDRSLKVSSKSSRKKMKKFKTYLITVFNIAQAICKS